MINVLRDIVQKASAESLAQGSYVDYHAPGVSYLCVHRSTQITLKVYFLTDRAGLLVNPHDHAYVFHQTILRGSVKNLMFRGMPGGVGYGARRWDSETRAWGPIENYKTFEVTQQNRFAGQSYQMQRGEIHTLADPANGCILFTVDGPSTDAPTFTWFRDHDVPRLDGLYRPMPTEIAYDCQRILLGVLGD